MTNEVFNDAVFTSTSKVCSEIYTVNFRGIDIDIITVEISISNGLPAFIIVGLPDKAVAESRERVRSVLSFIGLAMPPKKIVINMSPANLQKEGTQYDLPIALSILSVMDIIDKNSLKDFVCMGELSLNGDIMTVPGVLCASMKANSLNKGIICPSTCIDHAFWSGNKSILASKDIISLVNHFKGTESLQIFSGEFINDDLNYEELARAKKYFGINENPYEKTIKTSEDMTDVVGQKMGKYALELAAAGGHNLLFMGPPGVGKSMLANRIMTIIPKMNTREIIETAMVYNISNHYDQYHLMTSIRPFRAPHHSASTVSVIGGGSKPKPGEISLAHNGVLFLDEFPEFSRNTLESLRQPIENGHITITRSDSSRTYFAKFQLIAAMNLCMCGNYGKKPCINGPRCAEMYQKKVSKPILDRIDLQCYLPELSQEDIQKNDRGDSSATILNRVIICRSIQYYRYGVLNAFLSPEQMKGIEIQQEALPLLDKCVDKFKISMRERDKIIKVARTAADIDIAKQYENVNNAVSYFECLERFSKISRETQHDQVYDKNDYEAIVALIAQVLKISINKIQAKIFADILSIVENSSISKKHINEALSYRLRL
ncbi:YifB family Mg chelatase-like AAA ATPase [Candidatus Gromoviella agglomerans]|uniref:YifB family Mg chelatase-like AAA ATPase n=1 Tax=Candidatus Gromoviella agglomerans TaxID=2806609 RepID=UPI001E589251|nr:YifB family Mg chelatase-like AAA ATPase [Candidatus Gromoviella agglomerans]UFX98155.1 ATP-binding protein [Candidatus Gromoviella agglomerans]